MALGSKKSHLDAGSAFMQLRHKCDREWPFIIAAASDAINKKSEIQQLLDLGDPLLNEDLAIITFGSLARDEWTAGSDVDWTLLVDGTADMCANLGTNSKIRSINYSLTIRKFLN